jgi:acylpyruvate hydrolase
MRLMTAQRGDGTQAFRVEGDRAVELPYEDVGALLSTGEGWVELAGADGPEVALRQLIPAPLVLRPQQVLCIGLNYRTHIEEMGREVPAFPTIFAKSARALIGAREVVTLPAWAEQVDYEAELALVIGRAVRDVGPEEAESAIAGYTIMNDVSVRDWQWRTTQWWQGKNFERSTPLGPYLVTPDEAPALGSMQIECRLGADVVQAASCDDLVFGPAALVAYLSRITTLMPGDVIATGTPGGVAAGSADPRWIRTDDEVVVTVTGLGECVNRFVISRPEALDV